ncbi:MAG: Nal1-like putative serine protease [Candidatus Kariarchaeaceae archaeon]|jgi:hypothetical protein
MNKFFNRLPKFFLGLFVFIFALCPMQWEEGEFQGLSVVEAKVLEGTSGLQDAGEIDADEPQIQAAMAIQDNYTDALLAKPGIVGTATGVTEDGKASILVFAKSYGSAKEANIPKEIEGVTVVVEITGVIVPLRKRAAPNIGPTDRWPRPVPIGVSTGHPDITAGTIGCRVTDGIDVFALSNNHVYADENQANIGDNVLQPGPFDGGIEPDDAIGTLFDFEPIDFRGADNFIDAAIALSSTDLLGNATPRDGYGTPKSRTVNPSIRMRVMKYGRTTGFTMGRITAINATVNVQYDSGIARFVDQMVIGVAGFSSGGDSGSLIVISRGRHDRKPVGLLFAGSVTTTIANPIGAVLDRFGVTVDGD